MGNGTHSYWAWDDTNKNVTDFSRFAPGQYSSSYDCVYMKVTDRLWYVTSCRGTTTAYFICEKNSTAKALMGKTQETSENLGFYNTWFYLTLTGLVVYLVAIIYRRR